MIPLGYANATAAVSEEHRGWAIGIVSTGATVFLALGPVVGGVLVEVVGWRWIFLINLPVVAAIVTIGLLRIPESRSSLRSALDLRGLALLIGGLVSVVLALLNLQDWGLAAPATISLLSAPTP